MSTFGNTTQNAAQFKSFVSEAELDDRKKKRQEEWEKVRNPDQPLEAPEEEYDSRSLYERLQEQKDKKQAEFEEAHRLRNMIKGLDNDEIQFLDLVDKTKEEMEAKRLQEEGKEIEEYRKAVASMAAEAQDQKLLELKNSAHYLASGTTPSTTSQRRSQQALLAGVVVKRKSTDKGGGGDIPEKKSKLDDKEEGERPDVVADDHGKDDVGDECLGPENTTYASGVTCVGVLPGLGVYSDSSDSENSTDSDTDASHRYDLLGRPRWVGHGHSEQPQQSSSRA